MESIMQVTFNQGAVQLGLGQSAHLAQVCGAELVCLDGTAWITIDDDPRDIILTPGQSHLVDSNAAVIVTAIGAQTRFAVHAPQAGAARCQQPTGLLNKLLSAMSHRPVNNALASAL
jgi:Protein of unknown function (DUF2917)